MTVKNWPLFFCLGISAASVFIGIGFAATAYPALRLGAILIMLVGLLLTGMLGSSGTVLGMYVGRGDRFSLRADGFMAVLPSLIACVVAVALFTTGMIMGAGQ